jgi:hypothetical protein
MLLITVFTSRQTKQHLYVSIVFFDLNTSLLFFGGDLEARISSQPTGKFPEGARQPRLIVLATGRKQSTNIIHIRRCAYDIGSEIGREGWVRWMRTGSVG